MGGILNNTIKTQITDSYVNGNIQVYLILLFPALLCLKDTVFFFFHKSKVCGTAASSKSIGFNTICLLSISGYVSLMLPISQYVSLLLYLLW